MVPKSGEPAVFCGSLLPIIVCGAECVLAWVSHLSVPRNAPASGPRANFRSVWAPPNARFAAPASSFSFIRSAKIGQRERETPDVRPRDSSKPGAIGAVGSSAFRPCFEGLKNHRSVRPFLLCCRFVRTALVRRACTRRAEPEHRRPEARSLSQEIFPILGTGTPVVGREALPFKMKK